MPPNTVYVGRPTVWGNPYEVGSKLLNGEILTAAKAVELYRHHVGDVFDPKTIRERLGGKNLACWCGLDRPCHADILLELANGGGLRGALALDDRALQRPVRSRSR